MSLSTVSRFKCLSVFGPLQCIEQYDIDGITTNDYDSQIGYIRDLSLADAMRLYWLLEGFTLSIEFSGTVNSLGVDLSFSQSTSSSAPVVPTMRVCDAASLVLEAQGVDSLIISNPPDPDVSDTFTVVFNWLTPEASTRSPVNFPVTKQLDGKYTLWYGVNGDHPEALIFLRSPGVADIAFDALDTAVVSIESGTTTLCFVIEPSSTGTGTISAFSLTPNYYTVE